MDTIKAIHSRRSIRQYTGSALTGEQLETVLRAAMAAPSAGNAQTWEFVVVTEREQLERASGFHPGAAMLREAAAGILVCGCPEREKMQGFWVQDCSAAAQNLLLAAHDTGLGACWVGMYPIDAIVVAAREIFSVPEAVVPMAMIALGVPAESPEDEDRYDTNKIHHNRW